MSQNNANMMKNNGMMQMPMMDMNMAANNSMGMVPNNQPGMMPTPMTNSAQNNIRSNQNLNKNPYNGKSYSDLEENINPNIMGTPVPDNLNNHSGYYTSNSKINDDQNTNVDK